MATLTDLADGVRRLHDPYKKFSEIEIREELLTQRELLQAAREEIITLRDEITMLKAEAKAEGDFLARLNSAVEADGLYFFNEDDASSRRSAYCPACIERQDGLFRTSIVQEAGMPHACPNCKARFRHFS